MTVPPSIAGVDRASVATDALAALARGFAGDPRGAAQQLVDAARGTTGGAALAAPDHDGTLRWIASSLPCALPDRVVDAPPAGVAAVAVPCAAGDGVLWITGVDAAGVDALAAFAALALRVRADAGATRARHASDGRFASFMAQLPGLAWIKGFDGRYVFVNDAAARAFGRPPAELVGRTDDELFEPDTAVQFRANDRKVIETGIGVQTIETLEHPDGVHHSLVHKFAVPGSDGEPQAIGGIAIDITERVRVEQALKEADRHKDQFLATLAHELRNPLAPIRTGLQALGLAGDRDERSRQLRTIMERQVDQLARLVDELMEVSRITRGRVDLRRAPIDLADVVRSAVEAAQPAIEARRHALTVDFLDEDLVVDGDAMRLAQVVVNLLDNAAKYTEPGGSIALTVRADHGTATLAIRDDGIGIPRASLASVFELFTQLGEPTRGRGGLGIGLALVKRLVEMHGGHVEAASAGPGRGSEFRVSLPLVSARPGVVPPAVSPAVHLPRRRVLVVDDNRDAALCLYNLVQLLGMEAHAAFDGASALEAVRALRPDVVLLDLGMPGIDGYDVAERVRALPGGDDVVLVAVTGFGLPEDRARTQRAGFAQHLVKPADLASLRRVLGLGHPVAATA